jgi:microcystin-dependent protein
MKFLTNQSLAQRSMHLESMFIASLLLVLLALSPSWIAAQIGVGTTTPHPSSMLHIAPGAGNNKGVILPKITSGNLIVLDSTQNLAHGLIFFDTDLQKFYYFHQTPKKWFELDHDWIRKDVQGASAVVGTHIYLGVPGNVGIGTASTVNPAAKLTVVGNASIGSAAFTQDSVAPANSMIVETWVGIGTKTRTAGYEMDVQGQAKIHSTLTVTGSVSASRYFGEGVVPTNGIVMYSGLITGNFDANGLGQGSYTGWALCNGKNTTPDLRGRFIVGMSNTDVANHGYTNTEKNRTDYNSIGDVGGEYEHTLTISEMPSHNHPGSTTSTDGAHSHTIEEPDGCDDFVGSGQSGCYFANPTHVVQTASAGAHNHTVNVASQGGGDPHENRPPYYVLAFIMKLP